MLKILQRYFAWFRLIRISLQCFAKSFLKKKYESHFSQNDFEKSNSKEIVLENFMVTIFHSKFVYNILNKK
jgi:hypothetical protein